MTSRNVLVSLPGPASFRTAIAASRSGAVGIVDIRRIENAREAVQLGTELARYAKGRCGLKLGEQSADFAAELISGLPAALTHLIVATSRPDRARALADLVRSTGREILLEVTSLEQAVMGMEAGVGAVIAKGNEAGGWVGEESAFVLLQRLLDEVTMPVLAQGGIGLHSIAACSVAGASGVVLDWQLALTRESDLPAAVKQAIAAMDGSETVCLGQPLGELFRAYARPRLEPIQKLQGLAADLAGAQRTPEEKLEIWRSEVHRSAAWGALEESVWPIGQDAAFARRLADRFKTVGGVVRALEEAIKDHTRAARTSKPLAEEAPLARSHGTRYPIVQGPMTRVSDQACFAKEVADAGGLPFLALALLRAPQVDRILGETAALLGDRPWGAGILGFVPQDLRLEQLEVIARHHPSFALIAGGRPDQAEKLERQGVPTYLHVPSPGLLELFLDRGARRFVFEGRECGGHVGPRSSFVLWNEMVDILLDKLDDTEWGDCHLLFAGGIHDARSSSMVATLAAPLAAAGAKIGVLMGTAYLFTREAVTSGAIASGFQREAVDCKRTRLLETGPGHSTRCAETPFADAFEAEKARLRAEGRSPDEIRDALEELNLGRLRVAAKGVIRDSAVGGSVLKPLNEEEQRREGMYMLGQVAALRQEICTIAELHASVAQAGTAWLDEVEMESPASVLHRSRERGSEIAIVGMGCLLPKANDLKTYWENILGKVDAIVEVPENRWDWSLYYDEDRKRRDKIYSRWGGFLDEVVFDPVRYGMPPNSLHSIEPLQLLGLEVARAALEDAGYLDRPFPRETTSVILGIGGGLGDLGSQYVLRSNLPRFMSDVPDEVWDALPEWTEDSFAGILLNVAAGRVANRFDLGGTNLTVDAACASSLAAVYLAVQQLESRSSDMVIVGGADTVQNPFGYLCFSKTEALSPRGRCRPFDEHADGIVISEGLVTLVLKRLDDAERDGDRIYAVIKSVASSSDGRAKGMTAPHPDGQVRALERAYAKAGFSAATVGLIEAHGTGTVAGDRSEVESLQRVFEAAGATPQSCALGSVKSMIGHTKCTAGVAGMAKIALALHHKVLPPTLHVERPNPRARFEESPFFVNRDLLPWIQSSEEVPRRAGVSSFGFGGTNFHAVVEEYVDAVPGDVSPLVETRRPELLLFRAPTRSELLRRVVSLQGALAAGARGALGDLAYSLWLEDEEDPQGGSTLALVAASLDDLAQLLPRAIARLESGAETIDDPGIYFSAAPLGREGEIALLFPGQGSQYVGMMGDLACHFPVVREAFEGADRALRQILPRPLSQFVYPPPAFSESEERTQRELLTATNVAQPALGAAGLGLFRLLEELGVRPQMAAGHSYGEYVALAAAGVFGDGELARISEARGRFIVESAGEQDLGTMAAVSACERRVQDVLGSLDQVWVANLNSPVQTVISGPKPAIERAIAVCEEQRIAARRLHVACAFHSPLVAPAKERLGQLLAEHELKPPRFAVYSNTTGGPYPPQPEEITRILSEHLVSPVRFAPQIEAMYEAGARVFIEVGPRTVLSGLVKATLDGRRALALGLDIPHQPGLLSLLKGLGALAAHRVPLDLAPLFRGRTLRRVLLHDLEAEWRQARPPATAWLVNGGWARPIGDAHRPARPAAARSKAMPPASDQAPRVPTQEGDIEAPAKETSRRTSQIPPAPTSGVPTPDARPAMAQEPAPRSHVDVVMREHHRLMDRFLSAQRNVMLSALGRARAPLQPESRGDEPQATEVTETHETCEAAALHIVEPPQQTAEVGRASLPTPGVRPEADAVRSSEPERVAVAEVLIRLASERTGYPPEALDLGLEIEAGLGIDSIKRVEILGALQDATGIEADAVGQEGMDQLNAMKTLGEIAAWFERAVDASGPPGSPPTPEPSPAAADRRARETQRDEVAPLPRFRLTMVEVEALPEPAPLLSPDRVVVVTDDGGAVARRLADAIHERGGRAVLLELPQHKGRTNGDPVASLELTADWTMEAIDTLRRQEGPIGGVVHLLPLQRGRAGNEMDLEAWHRRIHREVKGLFYLAQAVAHDLDETQAEGRSFLIAATAMGGGFAHDGAADLFPGQGGVAGLMKTLAVEWPEVRCRAIDFDAGELPHHIVDQLLREMATDDDELEVGYRDSRRRVVRPLAAPLDARAARIEIDSESILLVIGGARGITATLAHELAERYRPTLLLVGSSPEPPAVESTTTAGLDSARDLKAALIAGMKESGQEIDLPGVERAYRQLLKEREMRSNLARLAATGATVRYFRRDARDEVQFGGLIDEIYERYGRIDGVINGAGIIEDKLLVDKQPESFDRVFDTKVASSFLLARRLRPESLRFLILFGSVAGVFPSRGQCDYAAANEVLNKLAVVLDRSWPGRVVSINWGPWDSETGMVGKATRKQFLDRGVQIISPRAGRRSFCDELLFGDAGDSIVVHGGGPWENLDRPGPRNHRNELPLLAGLGARGENGSIEISRRLDPMQDLYLLDHRLDGKPVLPAAMAMELMAEVSLRAFPDLEVIAVRDFQVLRGVVVENGASDLQLLARHRGGQSAEGVVEVETAITADDSPHPRYRAVVELAASPPAAPAQEPSRMSTLRPFPMSVDEAYRKLLFHGPTFQGIEDIQGIGDDLMVATCAASSPRSCLAGTSDGEWLIDPVVFDSALQMVILWARIQHDSTPLPARFRRYCRYGPLHGKVRCDLEIYPGRQQHLFRIDISFVGPDGRLLGRLEEMECPNTPSLNRLSGNAV